MKVTASPARKTASRSPLSPNSSWANARRAGRADRRHAEIIDATVPHGAEFVLSLKQAVISQ
jgi:hypothetical protein